MQNFNVSGMSCDHCKKAVTKAIQTLDKTAEVTIDLAQSRVETSSQLPRDKIVEAIAEAGYVVKN